MTRSAFAAFLACLAVVTFIPARTACSQVTKTAYPYSTNDTIYVDSANQLQTFHVIVFEKSSWTTQTRKGIIGILSGGFASRTSSNVLSDASYERLAGLQLSHNFVVLFVTHGNRIKWQEDTFTLSNQTSGFTASQILKQIEAASMWIKENADNLHIDATKLGSSGGSSGGYLSLSLLVTEVEDARVAAAYGASPVVDPLNYNESGDESFAWRFPELYIVPSYSAYNPLGLLNQAGTETYYSDTPTYSCTTGLPAVYPLPSLHQDLRPLVETTVLSTRIINTTGPAFILFGGKDRIAPTYSGLLWNSINSKYIWFPHFGHSVHDLDDIHGRQVISFFKKHLLDVVDEDADGVPSSVEGTNADKDPDQDGDGSTDGEEAMLSTSETDGSDFFGIRSVVATENSSGTWNIVIGFTGPSGSYHLESRPTWDKWLPWTDLSISTSHSGSGTGYIGQNGLTMPSPCSTNSSEVCPVFFRLVNNATGIVSAPYTAAPVELRRSGSTTVSLLSVPAPRWDLFRSRIASSNLGSSTPTITLTDPISLTYVAETYVAIVVEDKKFIQLHDLPESNPSSPSQPDRHYDEFGAEGQWWVITGITSSTKTISVRGHDGFSMPTLGSNCVLAIRRIGSLYDLFGDVNNSRLQENEIVVLDRTNPWVLQVSGTSPNRQWIADPFGASPFSLPQDTPLILPDEAVGLITLNGTTSYSLVVGQVPRSQIAAYLGNIPVGSAYASNFKSWPYPVKSPFFDTPHTMHAGLTECGFEYSAAFHDSIVEYGNPTSTAVSEYIGGILTCDPVFENSPPSELWGRVNTGTTPTVPVYPEFHVGRGYEMRLQASASQPTPIIWKRPRPYERP